MNQERIGNFISQRRKELGMTQKSLADKIDVSDKAISKWERGNGLPDISRLSDLCEALQINVNELLSGERLSDGSYSEKAEENIMSLIKENQNSKKNNIIQYIIGIVLAVITLMLLGISMGGSQAGSIRLYLDWPSFLLIALFISVIVFLSKKRTKATIISIIKTVSIPVSLFISMVNLIFVLSEITDKEVLAKCIAVSLIPFLYGLGIYLVAAVIKTHFDCE